jgi:hypothetical protein
MNQIKILIEIQSKKKPLEEIFDFSVNPQDSEIINNRAFFLHAVKLNGLVLEFANETIRQDKEIVMSALKQDNFSYEFVSDNLKVDKDVALMAVKGMLLFSSYSISKNLTLDLDFWVKAVKIDGKSIFELPSNFINEKSLFIDAIISNPSEVLGFYGSKYHNNSKPYNAIMSIVNSKNDAMHLVLNNFYVYEYLPENLKEDEVFNFELLQNVSNFIQTDKISDSDKFERARKHLISNVVKVNLSNEKLIIACIKHSVDDMFLSLDILKKLGENYLKNKEFILKVLDINGYLYRSIDSDLNDDVDLFTVALESIKKKLSNYKNKPILSYASNTIKSSFEIVLKAIETQPDSIFSSSTECKQNEKLIFKALENGAGPLSFDLLPMILRTRENYLISLRNLAENFSIPNKIPVDFNEDLDIIVESVKRNGNCFLGVSKQIQQNYELACIAVSNNGLILENLSDEFRDDSDLVLKAVKSNGLSFQFASERLKGDLTIAKEAVKNNPESIKFISEDIKNSEELLIEFVCHKSYFLLLNNLPPEIPIPKEILKNKETILNLIKSNPSSLKFYWKHIPEKLKMDIEILMAYLMNQ